MVGYYRHFVKDFSIIAKPMTKLTPKNVKFVWTQECEHCFQMLKEKLVTAPILTLPEPGKHFTVYSDASCVGLGCVLMQDGKVICLCVKAIEDARAELPHS